jgi:hypothetical protein
MVSMALTSRIWSKENTPTLELPCIFLISRNAKHMAGRVFFPSGSRRIFSFGNSSSSSSIWMYTKNLCFSLVSINISDMSDILRHLSRVLLVIKEGIYY